MRLGQVDSWTHFEEPDAGSGGGDSTATATTGKDASYWEAEAKKAFRDRDAVKQRARELEAKVMSDEDRQLFESLKEQQAKAEEARKRKEGEFDTLRNQLIEKHKAEVQEISTKFATLSDRFKQSTKLSLFGAATEWFGGDTAKTVLDVQLGMDVLGKYVVVEDVDDDPMGYRVVVKKPNGEPILGADGNPAPFAEAIGEVIKALPNKDRILRGSGKTGSGSAGGKTGTMTAPDLHTLTERARKGDKDALAALKSRQGQPGGIVFGSAFSR